MLDHAASDTVTIPPSASPLRAVENRGGYDYLLSLPSDCGQEASRRWPLLLSLHGTVARGDDVWAVTQQGVPKLLAGGPELTPAETAAATLVGRSFVVAAPQC